jgi:hypothetical protein
MVFKFFKEIVGAMKEGVAEAKTELAAENAEREAQRASDDDAARLRLELLPKREIFLTALGAPYRWLFVGESALDLAAMELPPAKVEELSKLLVRDFGAQDDSSVATAALVFECTLYVHMVLEHYGPKAGVASESAVDQATEQRMQLIAGTMQQIEAAANGAAGSTVSVEQLRQCRDELVDELGTLDTSEMSDDSRARLAACTARVSYLVTGSVGVGLIDRLRAAELLANLATLVVQQCASWDEFCTLYVAGEKADGTNNLLGRKVLSDGAKRLLTEAASPWTTLAWPQTLEELA